MKRYMTIFFSLIILVACNKDNGNYKYKEVNTLTVKDTSGNDITNRQYNLSYAGELKISINVSGTSASFDKSKVSYAWLINNDTISKQKDLYLKASNIGNGKKYGLLVVTDGTTGANYSYNFTVNITASISKGSFIITEDDAHNTYVSMFSSDNTTDNFEFSEFSGYKLGANPLYIDLGYSAVGPGFNNYKTLIVATQNADDPVMCLNLADLTPTLLYNAKSIMVSGAPFSPTCVYISYSNLQQNKTDGLTVIKGKVYQMTHGLLSNDVYASDPLNYSVGLNDIVPSDLLEGYYLAIYDQTNQRIRLFGNNLDPNKPYMFSRDYNEVINPSATIGHTFLAGAENAVSDWRFQFVTRKNSDLYLHNLIMDLDNGTYEPASFNTIGPKTVQNIDKAICFRFHGGIGFWYFAQGRTIYRFSSEGLDIQPFITLPDDGSGDIVCWNFNISASSNYTKIGIATYNASSEKLQKGSYYLYNIADRKLESAKLYSIKKAVDLKLGL